ncbi:DUF748 domain-containing protein [Candidatus Dependentiae bacterium]|nr:DUF748 domain-containing protein [Candidatus Dependentiae bacterium]
MKKIKFILILFILFSGAVFLLLPEIIRFVVIDKAEYLLKRDVEIKDIDFNVFKRNLKIDGLTIYEPDKKNTLLNIKRININFNLSKLINKNIFVYKIDFFYPVINVKQIENKFNFDDIVEFVKNQMKDSDTQLEYILRNIRITGGIVNYINPVFENKIIISGINYVIPEYSDKTDTVHSNICLSLEKIGKTIIDIDLNKKTSDFFGYIKLSDFRIDETQKIINRFIKSGLSVSGALSSDFSFIGTFNPFSLKIKGNTHIKKMKIVDCDYHKKIISSENLHIEISDIRFPENIIIADSFAADNVDISIELFDKNKTNIDNVTSFFKDIKTGDKTVKPEYNFILKKMDICNSSITFADFNFKTPLFYRIQNIVCKIENLNQKNDKAYELFFTGNTDNKDQIKAKLELDLSDRLGIICDIKLKNFNSQNISRYFEKYTGYSLLSGKINFNVSGKMTGKNINLDNQVNLDKIIIDENTVSGIKPSFPLKNSFSNLEDDKGQVNLRLPVKGNFSDPAFNLTGTLITLAVNSAMQAPKSPLSFFSGFLKKNQNINNEKSISLESIDFLPYDFIQTEVENYQKRILNKFFSGELINKVSSVKFFQKNNFEIEKNIVIKNAAKEKFYRIKNNIDENRKLLQKEIIEISNIKETDKEFIDYILKSQPENINKLNIDFIEGCSNVVDLDEIEKKVFSIADKRYSNLKKYIETNFKSFSKKIIFEKKDLYSKEEKNDSVCGFEIKPQFPVR